MVKIEGNKNVSLDDFNEKKSENKEGKEKLIDSRVDQIGNVSLTNTSLERREEKISNEVSLKKGGIEQLEKAFKTIRDEIKKFEEVSEKDVIDIPLEGRSSFKENERQDVWKSVEEFLNDKTQQNLILMGDACCGKSLFVRRLMKSLLESHGETLNRGKIVPIMINLGSLTTVSKALIDEHMMNGLLLNSDTIALLKKKLQFIFILEDFEGQMLPADLFNNIHLQEWNCKVIATCRTQVILKGKEHYCAYTDSNDEKHSFSKIIISPFTDEQIENLRKSCQGNEEEKSVWQVLSQMKSIQPLIRYPFFLSIAMKTLPKLLKEEKEISSLQAELYNLFIERWCEQQIGKLKDQGYLLQDDGSIMTNDRSTITNNDFREFNSMIAEEICYNKTFSLDIQNALNEEEEKLEVLNWQMDFFSNNGEMAPLLRTGWLLTIRDGNYYSFFDSSLIIHLIAPELLHGIIFESNSAFSCSLNDFIIFDKEKINEMAEEVKKKPTLVKLLFKIVDESKKYPFISTAAANAFTILVQAKIDLTKQCFDDIRIPGANLSGAKLDHSSFKNANLCFIDLNGSSVLGVDFTATCLEGVSLGKEIQCKGATISFVTGLSSRNFTLLKKGAALGMPSKASSQQIIQARDELMITEEFPPSFFCDLGLSSNNGIISVAGKTDGFPFILLEMLYKGRFIIYQIAFSDSNKEQKGVFIHFTQLTTKQAKELGKECNFISEDILNEKIKEFLKFIEENLNGNLLYNMKKNAHDSVVDFIEKCLIKCDVYFFKEKKWPLKFINKE
jgi:hypothetical protein